MAPYVVILILLVGGICLYKYTRQRRPSPVKGGDFEACYGQLLCDGKQCNPYKQCAPPERLFCQKIIKSVFPKERFRGQYTVLLPSNTYRHIDFAAVTDGGRPLAIELDGYHSHCKDLTSVGFDDQLVRQNELIQAGWTVLRFSFAQSVQVPGYCKEMLQRTVGDSGEEHTNLYRQIIYADLFVPKSDKELIKSQGALYSTERSIWYIPDVTGPKLEAFAKWKHKVWTMCLSPGCQGEAVKLNGEYGDFWKCTTCSAIFSDQGGRPVVKAPPCKTPDCTGTLKKYKGRYGDFFKCHVCSKTFNPDMI